jgi:hypothetical protein
MCSGQFGLLHNNFLYIGGSASPMSCFSLLYFNILEVRWILMETISSICVVHFPK